MAAITLFDKGAAMALSVCASLREIFIICDTPFMRKNPCVALDSGVELLQASDSWYAGILVYHI
jgi:hypothetical protein